MLPHLLQSWRQLLWPKLSAASFKPGLAAFSSCHTALLPQDPASGTVAKERCRLQRQTKQSDPERRRANKAKSYRRWWEKKQADKDYVGQRKIVKNMYQRQRYAGDVAYRTRLALNGWFRENKHRLDQFTWNRWKPVWHQDKVEKTCSGCGKHPTGGIKLWFQRHEDPTLWDCARCYYSSDMSDIVPIEGRERFYHAGNLEQHPMPNKDPDDQNKIEAKD